MIDIVANMLYVFGSLLALVTLFWGVWTYWDAHTEKLGIRFTVRRSIDRPYSRIHAHIWNKGRRQVFISEVTLAWGDKRPRVGNMVTRIPFEPEAPLNGPLQVGQGWDFYLEANEATIPLLQDAAAHSEDSLWVSILSPGGEILRTSGKEKIHTYVSLLAHTTDGEGHPHAR